MAGLSNFYEVLGVSVSSEQEVIDAAYRALMKKYHPDRFKGDAAEADRRAKLINEAYAHLRDPAKRSEYDQSAGLRMDRAEPSSRPNPTQSTPRGATERNGQEVAEPVSLSAAATKAERRARRQGFVVVGAMAGAFALLAIVNPTDEGERELATTQPVPATFNQPPVVFVPSVPVQAQPEALPAEPASCLGSQCRTVTAEGWAGIKAGMTVEQASAASGLVLRDDGHYNTAPACARYEVVDGPQNVNMLVERGVVTSITAYWLDEGPMFMTDRGVGLGDTEAALRSAYTGLHEEPDIYSDPPDKKLFYFAPEGRRGIKFSINGGRISAITFGGESIGYVEGCL